MSSEITTWTFYILFLVTIMLQMTRYSTRAKFFTALNRKSGLRINLKGVRVEDLRTAIQIVFPVRLESVQDEHLNELKKTATKFSTYWIISLLTTLILPILMYKMFGYDGH